MSTWPEGFRRLATFHEAAHAVVAFRHRFRVLEVAVPYEYLPGRMQGWASLEYPRDVTPIRWIWRVQLAGPQAELRAGGLALCNKLRRGGNIAEHRAGIPDRFVPALMAETRALLAEEWGCITAVANALDVSAKLDAEAFRALYEQHRRTA